MTPPPRICILFPHLQLGGGETAMIALAEALELRGDLAISPCALERRPPPPGTLGLRHILPQRFANPTFVTPDDLATVLAGSDAVIWYGLNDLIPSILTTLAARGHRPRSLRVIHTDKDEEVAHHHTWSSVIDATACVAPHMARRIPGATFIANTCSPDRLQGEATPRRAADPTLGYAGRLLRFKNLPWLVERLNAFNCHLAIQALDGEDLSADQLAAIAQASGTQERLHFHPPSFIVGPLFRSVHATVILSPREGFPMAVIEAGLLGVPVISTRAGALPDLFTDEEILFIDDAGGQPEPASFRQALARLHPAYGQRLAKKVASLCAPTTVAAAYADRMHEILGR